LEKPDMTRHSLRTRARVGAGFVAAFVALVSSAEAQATRRGSGIDTTNFDRSVRPQDDFFRFVNGGWLQRAEIPADASSWGAFTELRENSRKALQEILTDLSSAKSLSGERKKIADLYASVMDTARIEALGIKPIESELRTISKVQKHSELPATFARLAPLSVSSPVAVGVSADPKRSSVNVVLVNQSGLGMPDRDYYLLPDARMSAVRDAYRTYITKLFTLANQPDPQGAAERILALETTIAQKHWDRARSRDRNATYNMKTRAELAALSPSFDWNSYLAGAGLGKATEFVVRQPDYVTALDSIIKATPIATWREYLTFKLLDEYADELSSGFQQASFDFNSRVLSGSQTMVARWKRAIDRVNGNMGEAVGRLYVEKHFKPEAKARMDTMVRNLRRAYEIGIDSLDWMSPETKAAAKAKLAKFTVKIAYPDKWRDYSTLEIRRDDLVGNAMRAARFNYADMVSRLGKPVDKTRWGMTPQTVNAYYNASGNEIVFPAAILQPPFFDVNADDAVNYGGIGAVIGHEIGHGFDDQGRKSDGEGNLRDWWTAADASAFEERANKLGTQYAAISPLEGMSINPRLTMGENIGDLSGLAQAYRAYKLSLNGKEPPVIDGLTGDQRFFIGYAQIWRTKMRDEALRRILLSDSHSPGMARAFVPLVNNDAFQRAFNVQPGDRMYRAPNERVRIW
jgi:putative endopeptidase